MHPPLEEIGIEEHGCVHRTLTSFGDDVEPDWFFQRRSFLRYNCPGRLWGRLKSRGCSMGIWEKADWSFSARRRSPSARSAHTVDCIRVLLQPMDVDHVLQSYRQVVLRAETTAQISVLSDSLVMHREDLATLRADMMAQFKALLEKTDSGENSMLRFGSLPLTSGSPTLQAQGITPSSTDGVSMAMAMTNSAGSVSKSYHPLNLSEDQVILGFANECDIGLVEVSQASLLATVSGLLGMLTRGKK
ncbi:hypothetical protein ACLB2K_006189 [Fragaria x ananassa]